MGRPPVSLTESNAAQQDAGFCMMQANRAGPRPFKEA